MSELLEVRSTINMPALPVDRLARVDPEVPHIAMLLEAGYLVRTGRTFSVPTQNARRAVRPETVEQAAEAAKPRAKPKNRRKKAAPATTPPS